MRVSLIPRLVQNIEDNARHMSDFRLFEIGNEIHKQPVGLPNEVPHLAAAVFAREGDGQGGLFALKRMAEILAPGLLVEHVAQVRGFEHPQRTWTIHWQGEPIGRLFELHPSFCEHGRAAILDLDASALYRLQPSPARHKPLRRFPVSRFDITVQAGVREEAGAIQPLFAGMNVLGVECIAVWEGRAAETGEKSVTFRVTVGADDHTLSHEEIREAQEAILRDLEKAGYHTRA
jgi:phenylalanyl-tRNA synthetase beta chain